MGIAKAALGTQLKMGDGADPEVFTSIAEVRDISGPETTTATEDVSAHDGDGYVQKVATLKDGGDVTFTINYNSAASQEALAAIAEANPPTKTNFQIVVPTDTPTTLAFAAYCTSFSWALPVAGVITADITLSVTGAVTRS